MITPKKIAKIMLEKKAFNIKIFDVRKITTLTDYFIICSSSSEPQSRAILNSIDRTLKKKGIKAFNIEGQNKFEWILMDYISFVVHIFNPERRSFYDLDRLWSDAKIILIEEK